MLICEYSATCRDLSIFCYFLLFLIDFQWNTIFKPYFIFFLPHKSLIWVIWGIPILKRPGHHRCLYTSMLASRLSSSSSLLMALAASCDWLVVRRVFLPSWGWIQISRRTPRLSMCPASEEDVPSEPPFLAFASRLLRSCNSYWSIQNQKVQFQPQSIVIWNDTIQSNIQFSMSVCMWPGTFFSKSVLNSELCTILFRLQ